MELNANVRLGTAKLTVAETFKVLAAKQAKNWPGSVSIKGRPTQQRQSRSAD